MFVQYHLNRSRTSGYQQQNLHHHHQTSGGSSSSRSGINHLRAAADSSSGKQHAPKSPILASPSLDRQPTKCKNLTGHSVQLTFDFRELSPERRSASRVPDLSSYKPLDHSQRKWPSPSVSRWSARARNLTALLGTLNCFEPKRKIQLITEFCLNFLAYQLETLFLLAASAQVAVKLSSKLEQSSCVSAGLDRDQEVLSPVELQARRLNKRRASLLELHLQQRVACCTPGCESPVSMLPTSTSPRIGSQVSLMHNKQAISEQTGGQKLRQRSYTTSSTPPGELSARLATQRDQAHLTRPGQREPDLAGASQLLMMKRQESAQVRESFPTSSAARRLTSSSSISGTCRQDPPARLVVGNSAKANLANLAAHRAEIPASESLPTGLQAARKKAVAAVTAAAGSSKLSLAGARRRFGFKQRGLSSISVQRSEEVLSINAYRYLSRQSTVNSTLSDSIGAALSDASSAIITQNSLCCADQDPRQPFIEGLGVGQIASRQVLVSPAFGDIQLSLSDRRGILEIEVIRARSLLPKAGAHRPPAPYVKLYLMSDRKCIGKFKTNRSKPSLDPLFQQQFTFRHEYRNAVLQVIVWADYGKRDRKSLMGVAQIQLASLDISSLVVSWYRLFNAPSMACSSHTSSKALRHTI